jgi:hypothetical protein
MERPATPHYEANIHATNNCQKRKLPQSGKFSLWSINGPKEEETMTSSKRLRYAEIENIREDEQQISSMPEQVTLSELAALDYDTKFQNEILDRDIQNQEIIPEREQFILDDTNSCQKGKLPQSGKLSLGIINGPEEEETIITSNPLQYPETENIREDEQQISSILEEFTLSELAAHDNDTNFWNEIQDCDIQQEIIRELEQFVLPNSTADSVMYF